MSKERPILFQGAMVRAILDGSKTQTRRICKVQPTHDRQFIGDGMVIATKKATTSIHSPLIATHCPYGEPGDRLWVRETWADLERLSGGNYQRQAIYRADDIELYGDEDEPVNVTAPDMRWRPSIFMPRWASRILLEIVSVRVERLHDISEADANAEGCERLDSERYERDWNLCLKCGGTRLHRALGPGGGVIEDVDCVECDTYVKRYRNLWKSINGPESWEANPWVWVAEFARISA